MKIRRKDLEDLFFKVKDQDPRLIVGNTIFDPKNYRVMVGQEKLLGIKSYDQELESPKLFYLDNEQAYSGAKELFNKMFVGEPLHPIAFGNELNNWCSVILSQISIDFESIVHNYGSSLFDEEVDRETDLSILARIKPTIAFVNGFDYDDNLVFFLLVQLIPSRGAGKGHPKYLTIGRYEVSNDAKAKVRNTNVWKEQIQILRDDLLNIALTKFKLKYEEFQNTISYLESLPATSEELIAVALDVQNINRSLSTIRKDQTLRKRLNDEIRNTEFFFKKKNNFGAVVEYLIRIIEVDFSEETIFKNKFSKVFEQKTAYKEIIRRLVTYNDPLAIQRYVKGNVKLLNDVKEVL